MFSMVMLLYSYYKLTTGGCTNSSRNNADLCVDLSSDIDVV